MKILIPILSIALVVLSANLRAQDSNAPQDDSQSQKEAQEALATAQKAVQDQMAAVQAQATKQAQEAQKQMDEAQKEVQKQMKEAQKQIEKAQKEIQKQHVDIGTPIANPSGIFPGGGVATAADVGMARGSSSFSFGGQSKPLIVLGSKTDAKAQANLNEDLTVMRRILEKSLDDSSSEAGSIKAMGIDVFFARSGASTKSLYLEGYGALFVLDVSYPLISSTNKTEDKAKPNTSTSDWDEAKKEVYGQANSEDVEESEPFNTEKVDKLKDRLTRALKNAANIRGLKPTESVTLCVLGTPNKQTVQQTIFPQSPNANTIRFRQQIKTISSTSQGRTILTISASKADIDAYASGKLSDIEFATKVTSTPYSDTSSDSSVTVSSVSSGFSSGTAASRK